MPTRPPVEPLIVEPAIAQDMETRLDTSDSATKADAKVRLVCGFIPFLLLCLRSEFRGNMGPDGGVLAAGMADASG
jgi:hypothetical protein